MTLLGDHNINYTFYEDVRVPAENLVGGENMGWSLITSQLNHERVTLCSPGIIERVLGDVRAWAQQTKLPDGRRVIDQEWVQEHLARVHAELEFLRLINWKVAWQATQGRLDVADASSIKVFGTEFYLRAFRLLMEVIGQGGYLKRGSPAAVHRRTARDVRRARMIILTFGGGTNEIQRDLIAIFGLGLPALAALAAAAPTKESRWTSPTTKSSEAVRQLADQIFTERSTHERLKALEAAAGDEGPFDRDLWAALAEAGLLGIGLPDDVGGAGLDFVAVCLVVEAAGRTAAAVPVVESLAYGAPAIDRFGTDEQRRRLLPGIASGETVATAALAELVGDVVVPGGTSPATTATRTAYGRLAAPRDQGLRPGRARRRPGPGAGHPWSATTAPSAPPRSFVVDADGGRGDPDPPGRPRPGPRPCSSSTAWSWATATGSGRPDADGAPVLAAHRRAGHRRPVRPRGRGLRGGPGPHRASTPRPGSSSASPSPPSRRWASGRPTPTSTPRPSG